MVLMMMMILNTCTRWFFIFNCPMQLTTSSLYPALLTLSQVCGCQGGGSTHSCSPLYPMRL